MIRPSHNPHPRADVFPLTPAGHSRQPCEPVTCEQLIDTEITVAMLFDACGVLQYLLALDHAPEPDQPFDGLERGELDVLLGVCGDAATAIGAVVEKIAPERARGLRLAARLRHDVVRFSRDEEPTS